MLDSSVVKTDWPEETRYAGFVLRFPRPVCRVQCYATQIDDLMACVLHTHNTAREFQFKAEYSPDLIRLKTQLGDAHLSTKL